MAKLFPDFLLFSWVLVPHKSFLGQSLKIFGWWKHLILSMFWNFDPSFVAECKLQSSSFSWCNFMKNLKNLCRGNQKLLLKIIQNGFFAHIAKMKIQLASKTIFFFLLACVLITILNFWDVVKLMSRWHHPIHCRDTIFKFFMTNEEERASAKK